MLYFSPEYYILNNPDVLAANIDPRFHFLNHGVKEGRIPNPLTTDQILNLNLIVYKYVTGLNWLDKLIIPEYWKIGFPLKSYIVLFVSEFKPLTSLRESKNCLELTSNIFICPKQTLFIGEDHLESLKQNLIFEHDSIQFMLSKTDQRAVWFSISKGRLSEILTPGKYEK